MMKKKKIGEKVNRERRRLESFYFCAPINVTTYLNIVKIFGGYLLWRWIDVDKGVLSICGSSGINMNLFVVFP